MASLGDSYTVGLFSGAPCSPSVACPANSWSTGTNAAVNSHYLRLRALNPDINGRNFTFAASGRKVSDLGRQAQLAVDRRVDYVTIMLGLNDSCRESEATMTSVATFRSQVASGLSRLAGGLPDARILVSSIPDAERLRTILKDNSAARSAWATQNVCQVVLADPQSTAPAVVARRARARQRVIDFNRQLAEVCAQYPNCRYDGGAVFGWQFDAADFVTRDYFHLSSRGEAGLADVSYAAGFDFSAQPPPPAEEPPPVPVGSYAGVVATDRPLAHWRFGEATGTLAANAVSGGAAGNYVGGHTLGAAGAIAGDANTAVALDGRSGYVSVPHEPSLNVGDAFTLEAWVQRGRTGVSQGLLSKGSRSYQLYFDAGDRLILRMAGVGEITRSTVTLTDRSAFHHVAVAKSGSTVRLYIDGVDRTGPVANRTLQNTTGNLIIGAGSGFFTGTLDEVAVYDRALDAAAVARHHSAGRG